MQKAAGTLSYINPGMEIKAKGEDVLPSTIERPKNTLMVFRHVLTTSTKDRDGDILRTSGAKPDPRMLLLWQHVHTLPIGKMLAVAGHTKDELQLYSCIIDMNDLCHDAAVMVDNGMGRFSHGFRALNFLEIKEGRDSAGGFDVKEFEILEESLVSVPANPDAETEEVLLSLVEDGKLTSPLMKDYGQAVRLHRPIRIPVQFDVKVSVDNQEVKSHAIEPRDEKREGERPGTGPSEKAEAVVDEGWEEEKSTENDEVKAKADEKPGTDGFGKVECPECGEEVVPDEDGECPECGATIEEEKPEEEKQLIDDPASGGTLAVPPKQGYGKEDMKMVCPECDYTGPGKEGKCPKCGAKLTPSKDFILEKLGRVLSKANEGKIRDAIDDLEEASKMDGIPRGCKALVVQAKRSLGNVVDSLGTDSGVEKSELKMDAKQALAILLASGGEDERKLLSSVLKAIEDGIRDDETTKQYSELLASN